MGERTLLTAALVWAEKRYIVITEDSKCLQHLPRFISSLERIYDIQISQDSYQVDSFYLVQALHKIFLCPNTGLHCTAFSFGLLTFVLCLLVAEQPCCWGSEITLLSTRPGATEEIYFMIELHWETRHLLVCWGRRACLGFSFFFFFFLELFFFVLLFFFNAFCRYYHWATNYVGTSFSYVPANAVFNTA